MSKPQDSKKMFSVQLLREIRENIGGSIPFDEKDIKRLAKDAFSNACHRGNREIVELLLDHGVPIDTPFENGMTGLSWASNNGHVSVVKLLLDRGADKRKVDDEGKTPLDHARIHVKNLQDDHAREYDERHYSYNEYQSLLSIFSQIIKLLE